MMNEEQFGGLKEPTMSPDEMRAKLMQDALKANNGQVLGEVAMPGVILPVGDR